MAKHSFCIWCWKPVVVPDTYNRQTQKTVCSRGCRDAERLFNTYWSEEEVNRRAHYRQLTQEVL